MSAHLTEEEQIEALKRWWSENGKILTAAVVVALGGFWGWSQYQSYQVTKAKNNAIAYQQLSEAISELETSEDKDAQEEKAVAIAKQLSSEQSDTLYGDFAQMYLAKQAIEKGDWQTAKVELEAVVADPANPGIKELAQLRLARVLAASGDEDQALSILSSKVSKAFESLYAEVKGDIYLSQDKLSEARAAYQKATDALDASDFMRRSTLKIKLDNTTVASDMPDITPSENPHGAVQANGDA